MALPPPVPSVAGVSAFHPLEAPLVRNSGAAVMLARWWLVSAVLWLTLAVLAVTQGHFSALQRGLAQSSDAWAWWKLFGQWLPRYAVWALLSPPIFWLAMRFLIRRDLLGVRVALHVAGSVGVAVVGVALHSLTICAIWPHASLWAHVQKMFFADFTDGIVTYWIVLLAAHAYAFRGQARERELAALRLDAQLKTTELALLRLQLNPHFLFNALNTLGVLMRENHPAADRLLERLSLFLRAVLAGATSEETTLADEIASLDHYLAVEGERFGDRLRVEKQIAPDTLDAAVPRLLLQPLVENAIKHGIMIRQGGGSLTISAQKSGDQIVLEVADDGPGWKSPAEAAPTSSGVGIANTRLRLEKRHGTRQQMEFLTAPGGGALVRLIFPYVRYSPANSV
jgi:two-component system LytT family sensor kinase